MCYAAAHYRHTKRETSDGSVGDLLPSAGLMQQERRRGCSKGNGPDQTQITRGTEGLIQAEMEPAINTWSSLFIIKLIFQWLLETVKRAFSPR